MAEGPTESQRLLVEDQLQLGVMGRMLSDL